jgi:hypothetical protein
MRLLIKAQTDVLSKQTITLFHSRHHRKSQAAPQLHKTLTRPPQRRGFLLHSTRLLHSRAISPPTFAARIERLSNELVAQIARNTDKNTLLALASTSRHLREGSFSVYGPRFFTTLKFCLHPISLQALHDISCTPYIAKYVFNVAFGTEDEGASDAIHDVDLRKNQSPHSVIPLELISSIKELHLSNEPMQTESAIISQALLRFQKLAMIMIGEQCTFEGTEIRPSIGKVALVKFACRCIHCKNQNRSRSAYDVYLTAASAIKQM